MKFFLLCILCVLIGTILFLIRRHLQTTVVMSVCGNVEDVNRVKEIWKGNLVIYDKCGFCIGIPGCRVLPNVGREQGTWVTYILENYNILPNEIIFLPAPIDNGNRFERFKAIINGLRPIGDALGHQENFVLDEWKGAKLVPADQRPFRKWFETNIGPWTPCRPASHFNGIMRTTRDNILKKPIEFYENLNRQLSVDNNTEVAHFMERSMEIVF